MSREELLQKPMVKGETQRINIKVLIYYIKQLRAIWKNYDMYVSIA